MRILHTSDWHLGRSLHRVDLLCAQAAFLDSLIEVVRSEAVDTVIVAGDVFDRALPGVEAVSLLDHALNRLVDAGAMVIVSSGNHDSPRRLGLNARLLERTGLHLRTDVNRIGEPVLLADRYGPVAVYPLPYLEPALVADRLLPAGTPRTHAAVMGAAVGSVRTDLTSRRGGTRSVLAAHAFVVGGRPSDSERELAVGGLSSVPLPTFDGVDYVALGHLHGRQQLSPSVRYSGSPLAYSFSEADHAKGSWLVELGPGGIDAVEAVPAPVPRPLVRLRGELRALLADPAHARAESAWCQITLTDPTRPAAAMDQLRRRFPHTLELRHEPVGGAPSNAASYSARTAGRSELDVCCGFLEHVRGGRAATDPEVDLLREALEAVLLDEVEDAGPAPGTARSAAAEERATSPADPSGIPA